MFILIKFVSISNNLIMASTIIPKKPDKGDPSDILQNFPNYNIKIHCCRYWWLKNWEFNELSYPYWRIYYNDKPGAKIFHQNKEVELSSNKIIIIAPNTSCSTRIDNNALPENEYNIKGGRIDKQNFNEAKQYISHLFIHFNIGFPYDNISPGIFEIEADSGLLNKIKLITTHLKETNTNFNFSINIIIHSFINDILSHIPESSWGLISNDNRILSVLNFVEENISYNLDNETLATEANMATNSFIRLFRQEIGITPQLFVKRKRVDEACVMLHHLDLSINTIASKTGFADRYHFSRIFKQKTGFSPAQYRKNLIIR